MNIEVSWWRTCRTANVLHMEEEIDEESDEIVKGHEKICSQEKDELLYDIKDDKVEPIKNEISRNVSKDVIGFGVSCNEKAASEVLYGSTNQLA